MTQRSHLTFDERFLAELRAASAERLGWFDNMIRAAKREKGLLGRKRAKAETLIVGGAAGATISVSPELVAH